jgi:hypothetical protein
LAIFGCAHRASYQACSRQNLGPAIESPLPIVAGCDSNIDLASAPTFETVQRAQTPKPNPGQFRVLDVGQCQCTAATRAPLANLLDAERGLILERGDGGHRRKEIAQSLALNLIELRALEERNEKAASAVEVFYHLAEADYGRRACDRSLSEIAQSLADFEQLQRRGLVAIADDSKLRRQQLELLDRRMELNASARQLEGQLCVLLGFESDPLLPVCAAADLLVVAGALDVEAAIAIGLANRADLKSIAMLTQSLSSDTLVVARAALKRIDQLLGTSPPHQRMSRLFSHDELELSTRQAQLQLLWQEQTREVKEEVRQSAVLVETRLQQVGLARNMLDAWTQELARLRDKRGTEGAAWSEVSAAQLEFYRAENELVRRIVAWKIAQVKLKKAQGLLALECGYRLPPVCQEACEP